MTTLDEMKKKRPVRREDVAAHKRRMLAEVRAWKLKELRELAQLSQEAIAEELQISQSRVSRIEGGDIERSRVETLRRYAEALGGELHVTINFGDTSDRLV